MNCFGKIRDMMEQKLYKIFEEIGIKDYSVKYHEPILTIEQADEFGLAMEGLNLKNLFLREKKTGRFFMLILDDHRQTDLKYFKEVAGWKQVSFAKEEELLEILGVGAGTVTPLALFHDEEKRVVVVLDREISEASDLEKVSFHPCRNDATLTMTKIDFIKFLEHMGNTIILEKERDA